MQNRIKENLRRRYSSVHRTMSILSGLARTPRHLWFALRDWRGDDPEDYFGRLGAWAENRMNELRIN